MNALSLILDTLASFGSFATETSAFPFFPLEGRVESITMFTVESIPDYAFDSCERLQKVDLGAGCKKIGLGFYPVVSFDFFFIF